MAAKAATIKVKVTPAFKSEFERTASAFGLTKEQLLMQGLELLQTLRPEELRELFER